MNAPDTPPSPSAGPERVADLVRRAENAGASDIHLHLVEKRMHVSFRLDGVLTPLEIVAADLSERVVGRIKYLARLKTYEDSLPQEGRINREDLGSRSDLRVATYPTVTGEKLVLRLFTQGLPKSLEELRMSGEVRLALDTFLRQESGLLLLTGPAGSGKTTTIYACLRHLASLGGRHIITVEDPVEQIIPGIMQTEINEARGLTFAKAARHLLRQDPQVLVLGEIRDEETAALAVRSALTGHMVIATLHAGSCKGVLERLLLMCPDRYAVLGSLSLVLNQRLLRRRCGECGGAGCGACLGIGYRGRVPVVEWLRVEEPLRTQLRSQGPDALPATSCLREEAAALVARGESDESEVTRLLGPASPLGVVL